MIRWLQKPFVTLCPTVAIEPQAGAPFHLWDCHRHQNQLFSRGDGETIKVETGFCIDAAGGSADDGTPLVGWSCHGERNQRIGYWF